MRWQNPAARATVALGLLEREPGKQLSPSWTGEYLAQPSLVLAVAGHDDAAFDEARSADSATLAVEARGFSAFARAIVLPT